MLRLKLNHVSKRGQRTSKKETGVYCCLDFLVQDAHGDLIKAICVINYEAFIVNADTKDTFPDIAENPSLTQHGGIIYIKPWLKLECPWH